MAKASAADLKKEGEALKALFAKVKKKPHFCAILMAKDGIVIEAHIKKSPEVLLKLAKKNGGMAKGAWGSMTMEGQVILVDPVNEKIPGNLAKQAKKYFSERGVKYRLEIKEPVSDEIPQEENEDNSFADGNITEIDMEPEFITASEPDDDGPDDEDGFADGNITEIDMEPELITAGEPDDDGLDDEDDIAAENGDWKALFRALRKKSYNFAWLKAPDGLVLKAHRRKSVDILMKMAREEGGKPRGAWGQMHLDGKTMVLHCLEDPPGAFARQAKTHLLKLGQKCRVMLHTPSGDIVIEEDDNAPAPDESTADFDRFLSGLDPAVLADLNSQTDEIFYESTDFEPGQLIPSKDHPMAKVWLNIRKNLMAEDREYYGSEAAEESGVAAPSAPKPKPKDRPPPMESHREFRAQELRESSLRILGLSGERYDQLAKWADENYMREEEIGAGQSVLDAIGNADADLLLKNNEQGGDALAQALSGKSPLGALTNREKSALINQFAQKWIYSPEMGETGAQENIAEFAAFAKNDPQLSRVVSYAFIMTAHVNSQFNANNYDILEDERDIGEQLRDSAIDLDPEMAVRLLTQGKNGGTHLAKTALGQIRRQYIPGTKISGNPDFWPTNAPALSGKRQDLIMNAIANGALGEEKTDQFFARYFASSSDFNVSARDSMFGTFFDSDVSSEGAQKAMASLMTHSLSDEKNMSEEQVVESRQNLGEIMGTAGGREVLFSVTFDEKLRMWALDHMMPSGDNPDKAIWTAQDLAEGWESKVVCNTYGESALKQAKQQNRIPHSYDPKAQKTMMVNDVGLAFGMPFTNKIPKNETKDQRKARLSAQMDHQYYDYEKEPMAKILEYLEDRPELPTTIIMIPVTVMNRQTGASLYKVLRIEKGENDPAPVFVDHSGRRYRTPDDWVEKNELPPGQMTFPIDLDLANALKTIPTPNDGTLERVLTETDKAVAVAATVAGVAIVIGSGGTAAPLVAGAAGLYSGVRAGTKLAKISDLGYDVTDLGNDEVRGLVIEVAASAFSGGALGGSMRAAKLAAQGTKISRTGANLVAGLTLAGNVTDAVAMADSIQTLSKKWDSMTEEQKTSALMSLGFQAGMKGASVHKGGGMKNEFDFQRIRNQLEFGSPFAINPVGEKSSLKEGQIVVAYDQKDGKNPTNFRIEYKGKKPPQEIIDIHVQAAISMEATVSLRARFSKFVSGESGPKSGSPAWEAIEELKKIDMEANLISDKLINGLLSPKQLDALRARQLELNLAIIRESKRLEFWEGKGRGFVAEPTRGADDAKALFGDDVELPDGYVWVATNGEPFAAKSGADRLYYDKKAKAFLSEIEIDQKIQSNNAEIAGALQAKALASDPRIKERIENLGLNDLDMESATAYWATHPDITVDKFVDDLRFFRSDSDVQNPVTGRPSSVSRALGPVQPSNPRINPKTSGSVAAPASVMDDATRRLLRGHDAPSKVEEIAGTGGIETIKARLVAGQDDGAMQVSVLGEITPSRLPRRGKKDADGNKVPLKPGQSHAPDFNADSGSQIAILKLGFAEPKEWQRCHLFGPGFGDEAAAGMFVGPKEFNQKWQSSRIENLIRELGRQVAPHRASGFKLKVLATAETWGHPTPKGFKTANGELILKEVKYEIMLETPGGTKTARVSLDITTDPFDINNGVKPKIVVGIAENTFRDLFSALPK